MDLHPDLIDLLTEFKNSGVEYLIVGGWAGRETIQWQGIEAHIIGFDDLCESKRAAARPKDLADLRQLQKFRR